GLDRQQPQQLHVLGQHLARQLVEPVAQPQDQFGEFELWGLGDRGSIGSDGTGSEGSPEGEPFPSSGGTSISAFSHALITGMIHTMSARIASSVGGTSRTSPFSSSSWRFHEM